jgi:hypothetical protein
MTPRFLVARIVLALALALPAGAGASALDLPAPLAGVDGPRLAQATTQAPAAEPRPVEPEMKHGGPGPAGAALRSLLIPGWGQLASGHKTQAAIFGALELGTWTSYATFQRQGALRRDTYFMTARLFAGIDLKDKDTNYRKLVGQYRSSDVYNQYVVLREATFFYTDPTERQQYIDSRSIPAANAWSWGDSFDQFERYKAQRRASEQAFKNGQYALGFAVINRLVSAVAAARVAASRRARERTLGEEAAPGHPTARMAWSVEPGRGLLPDARMACVVRF